MKKVNFNINKVLEELEKNAMTSEITSDLEMQVKDEEVAIHYQFTPGDIYSYFITMNHNKKSHSNLSELSKVISDAYSVSPLLANKMWNNLWDENRLLKGLQKRYFILVIYQNLLSLLGVDNAIALLLMEKYRLELALDQDYCGTEDVLKAVGKHYIEKYKYQDLMDIYDKYLKVNNINDRPESNEKICSLICSILAPINKSYDRIAKTLSTEKNLYYPGINPLIDFFNYLTKIAQGSKLFYIVSIYISCIQKEPMSNTLLIHKCLDYIEMIPFRMSIIFLYLNKNNLNFENINRAIRKIIAKYSVDYVVLDDEKDWLKSVVAQEDVFLGFFEKEKCLLAEFEIDFLIRLMLNSRWDKLQECFTLVVKNGDACRIGSLLSFISNTIQSWKRIYTSSTLNVDDGPFKIKIEVKHSVFCGIEYTEIASIDKTNMIKYRDVLYKLLNKLPIESRESQTLNKSIQDLEERLA